MAITRYAGDRFVGDVNTTTALDSQVTGVLDGAFYVSTGNLKTFVKRAAGWAQVAGGGGGGSTDPAGADHQVQFNDNGVFGANANLTFDGSKLSVNTIAMSGIIYDSNNSVGNGGMVLTNEGTTGVNWKNIESVLSGVGGSGVANYVARWSDEDTLTSGVSQDNGLWGVGINMAPDGNLAVKSTGDGTNVLNLVHSSNDALFNVRQSSNDALIRAYKNGGTQTIQLHSDGDSYITGSLGLGTAYPDNKLHIVGDNGDQLKLDNDGDTWTQLNFANNDTNKTFLALDHANHYFVLGAQGGYSDLKYISFRPDGTNDDMVIKRDGNVGIGTTDPAYRLEVKASITGDWLSRIYNTATTGNHSGLLVRIDNPSSTGIILGANANGTYRFVVKPNGNVGIGTNTPAALLQLLSDGAHDEGAEIFLKHANNNTTDIVGTILFGNNVGGVAMIQGGTTGANNTGYISFSTDNAGTSSEKVRIIGDGNVGIGTNSPAGKLHILSSDLNNNLILESSETGGSTAPDLVLYRSSTSAADNDYIGVIRFRGKNDNGTPEDVEYGAITSQIKDSTDGSEDGELALWTMEGGTLTQQVTLNSVGNVGIGTNAPAEILEVVSDSDPTILIRPVTVDSANSGKISYRENAGGTTGVDLRYDGANNKFIIDTSDVTNALVIKRTDGNVGIGSGAPNSKVDVLTPSRSTTFAPSNGATWHDLIVRNPNNTQNAAVGLAFELNGTYHANAAAGIAAVKEVGSSDYGAGLAFVTRPQSAVAEERVRIAADGKVGIGTTDPQYLLEVYGDATLNSSGATTDVTLRWEAAGATKWRIKNDTQVTGGTDHTLTFTSAGAANISINQAGNVGIGTNDPASLLTVYEDDSSAGNTQIYIHNDKNDDAAVLKLEGKRTSANDTAQVLFANSGNSIAAIKALTDGADDGLITFSTSANGSGDTLTEYMRIKADGNVGIGTNAPSAKLEVAGDTTITKSSGATKLRLFSGNDDPYISFGDNNTNWAVGVDRSESGAFKISNTSGVPGTSDKITVLTDGNVGIGTTAPVGNLHVYGGQVRILDSTASPSYGARLVVGRDTAQDIEFYVDDLNCKIVADQDSDSDGNHNFILDRSFAGNGDNNFQIQKGGSSQFLINTDGNVGINNTSPEHRLHVAGDAIISGYLYDSTNSTGVDGYVLTSKEDGPQWKMIEDVLSGVGGNGTANYVPKWVDSDTLGDSVIYDDGDIGIGTNNPQKVLEVDTGTTDGQYVTFAGTIAAGKWQGIHFGYRENNANYRKSILAFEREDGAARGKIHILNNAQNGSNSATLADSRMTIQYDGNVGIGITTPSAKLHVNAGDIVITGAKQLISINAYTQAPPGMLTTQGPSTGATTLGTGTWGIMMGPEHTRSTTANTYYPGIAFNHLLNNGGATTWNNHPQAWIGTRLHDTSGSERAFLVFSTKSGSGLTSSDVPLERMCIDPVGGLIGIGTTDPAYSLDIRQAAGDVFVSSTTGTNRTGFQAANTGGTSYFYRESSSGGGTVTGALAYATVVAGTGDYPLQFGTNGAVRMIVTSGGKVGIGNTAPDSPLHVKAAATSAYVQEWDNSSGNLIAGVYSNGSDGVFQVGSNTGGTQVNLNSNGNSYFRGGNVGIGTVTPYRNAHIYQAADSDNFEGALQAGGSSASLGGYFGYNSTSSGRLTISSLNNTGGANAKIYLGFGLDGDGSPATEVMILTQGGSVGIGTNAPASIFHIHADSASTQELFFDNDGTGAMGMTFRTDFATDAGRANFIYFDAADDGGNNVRYSSIESFIVDNTDTEEDGRLTFSTMVAGTDTETMHIVGANVGIGTNAPANSAKLDVRGRISVREDSELQFGTYADYAFMEAWDTSADRAPKKPIAISPWGGSVGIGITAPSKLLDLNGTAYLRDDVFFGNTVLNIASGFSNQTGMGFDKSAGQLQIAADETTALELGRHSSAGTILSLRYESTQVATIESGGQIRSLSGAVTAPSFSFTNDTTTGMSRPTTSTLNFITNATERARINADGELLVGLTSDLNTGSKIHVNSAIALGSSTYTYSQVVGGADLQLISNGNPANLGANSNIIFKLGTSGGGGPNEAMRIVSTGNVGIGTTTPDSKLEIVGGGWNSSLKIKSSGSETGIQFEDSGGTTDGYIYAINGNVGFLDSGGSWTIQCKNDDYIRFAVTSNTEHMRITSAGNVGIGTDNPTGNLQIGNNYTINASYGNDDIYIASTGSHASYDPYVTNTDDFGALITISDNGATGPTKPGLVLYNDDTTAGGFSPMLLFAKREAGSSPYKAATAAIYTRSPLGTGDGDSWIDGELIFATAGAATNGIRQRMVINKEGNVGIGVTNPAGRLQVNQVASDQSGAAALKVVGTAYGTNKAIHSYMNTSSATKSLLYVENSSGAVLDITGDGVVNIASSKMKIGGSAGTDGYVLTTDGAGGIAWEASPGAGSISGSGSTNKVAKFTGGSAIGNSQITDDGTSVGINVSPNAANLLEVNGQARATTGMFGNSSVANVAAKPIHIKYGGTAALRLEDSTSSNYVYDISCDFTNGFRITDVTSTKDPFTIAKTTGNVGIGITNPSRLFHVNGGSDYNARFTSASTRSGIVIDKPGTTTIMGSVLVLADETYKLGTASYYHVVMTQAGVTSLLYQGSTKIATTSAGVTVTGTLTETSSIAIKENVETYTPSLDIINKIRPVKYNRKENKKKEIGLIAEELAELFPELVEKDEKGNPSSVNYSRAVTVLLGGFKELYKEVQELKKRI